VQPAADAAVAPRAVAATTITLMNSLEAMVFSPLEFLPHQQ
jgi:hypothetical protein